jgi:DNA recombination protein RmuC
MAKNQEKHFELMAQEILQTQSDQFKLQAGEQFESVTKPFGEKVKEYKEYYESMQRYDLKDRESLREKLAQMMDSATRIETKASDLTNALTSDVKFQGSWGELALENILDLAGLEKNSEYFVQPVLQDEERSQYRPDIMIKLPNDSKVFIDSKVSLKAYFDYMNGEDRDAALKNLKLSVTNHIESLSKKNYQDLGQGQGPDFVYLFIPVEGVFSAILKNFPEMLELAIKKNILLVSPVNLIANLKSIASIWRIEKQSKNAMEMARKAGLMHDKFVSLVDDMDKLSQAINKTQSIHESIETKLSRGRGNLVDKTMELRDLGAKTSKNFSSNTIN